MARHSAASAHLVTSPRSQWRVVLYVVLVLALLLVVVTQSGNLPATWAAIRGADPAYSIAALLLAATGYLAAAGSYLLLAAPRIRYAPTVLVQVASGFTNRLLPAGLGGLGLFAAYLHRQGYSVATASALVGTNNLLGAAGSILLLVGILIVRPEYSSRITVESIGGVAVLAVSVGLAGAGVLAIYGRRHTASLPGRLFVFGCHTVQALRIVLSPGPRTAGALGCNMVLTSLNAAILCLCALSVGAHVEWPEAVLIISLGTAVGAVVPSPGGVGGVETGLLAGLMAFGVSPAAGLAAVLLYRVVTFWVPIVPGVLAFRLVERRYI